MTDADADEAPTLDLALLEVDLEEPGIIRAGAGMMPLDIEGSAPDVAVLCFFQEVIESLAERGDARRVGRIVSEIGPNPLFLVEESGTPVLVVHPGVGAPLAAAMLEEVIAIGCTRIVACGGAGALSHHLVLGHPVIVDEAVRDEGTSFHYLAASRTVVADPHGVGVLAEVLEERGVPYLVGKSWTTDGFYREAKSRIERRRAEGCLTVEMEAAAFMAVARFHGVSFAQLLYAGDSVAGDDWDHRGWNRAAPIREQIFRLALAAAIRL